MIYVKYFLIGMWLTFQSLWCDNSSARAEYYTLRDDLADTVQHGEELAKGIMCAIVVLALVIVLFYVWGMI